MRAYIPFFDHEDACIYSCGIEYSDGTGHNDDCGCTLYLNKSQAQKHLIAQLDRFIDNCQMIMDDAKVRRAQIQRALLQAENTDNTEDYNK